MNNSTDKVNVGRLLELQRRYVIAHDIAESSLLRARIWSYVVAIDIKIQGALFGKVGR